ncbi:hypothetical protein [Aestuariivita sp.]|uniref:hypothetical protein n=1 Tax=Aestuariivita sp. TaxID=1872407 RepID=UPI003BAED013
MNIAQKGAESTDEVPDGQAVRRRPPLPAVRSMGTWGDRAYPRNPENRCPMIGHVRTHWCDLRRETAGRAIKSGTKRGKGWKKPWHLLKRHIITTFTA